VNVCLVLVGSRCIIGTSAGHVKRFSEGADADGTAIAKVRGALGGGTAIREGMDRKWEWVGIIRVIVADTDKRSPARISRCRLAGAD
jgi:hypothetical protein